MVKNMALGIAALIALLLAWAATRPNTFRVERGIAVNVPAAKIFPLLNDFHQFASWSPWQKLDPAMNVTHSGAAAGPRAVYQWEGNKKVGSGRMEVLEQVPITSVTVKLDFLELFEGHNTPQYTLKTEGATTTVT